jgi:hypothetical protein
MPGKNEGVAIIHNERVTHYFNKREEYVEYEQERIRGALLDTSIVKQEEANRELSDRLSEAERIRWAVLNDHIINDTLVLKIGDKVDHIISGQIESKAGRTYHIINHVATGITMLDETAGKIAQEIEEYDEEWSDWHNAAASAYGRSPPPPRLVTRQSWRRSQPMSWEPSLRGSSLDLAYATTRVKRERDVVASAVTPDIGVHVTKGVVVKHDPEDVSNKRAKSEEHEDDTTAQAVTSSSQPVVDENKRREEWMTK